MHKEAAEQCAVCRHAGEACAEPAEQIIQHIGLLFTSVAKRQQCLLGAVLPTHYSPMRSAFSSERSSSSRFGKVRKISEEGKGECRNTPARMRLKRLRRREGKTSKW